MMKVCSNPSQPSFLLLYFIPRLSLLTYINCITTLLILSSTLFTLHSPLPTHTYTTRTAMDRSSEFFSTVESLRSRAQPHLPSDKRRLLSPMEQQAGSLGAGGAQNKPKSEVSLMATMIGKDIHATSIKLQKLARCMVTRQEELCIECIQQSSWALSFVPSKACKQTGETLN